MSTQDPMEPYTRRSLWSRFHDRLFGIEDGEEEEHDAEEDGNRRHSTIRLDTARAHRVAIRLNASVFNDARIAADGLKNGQQQIVNLEKAAPQMAERIIDFLSGVTYALDGTVDRVGEKVYLFAPANVEVELDAGTEPHGEL
ncbi:MAG: cell division protein SepF [Chthonomonadales bacterium]